MYGVDFYSVKFYPYTEPGIDPVFAIVGGKFVSISCIPTRNYVRMLFVPANEFQILIGKPPADVGGTTEYIQQIVNEGVSGINCFLKSYSAKDTVYRMTARKITSRVRGPKIWKPALLG